MRLWSKAVRGMVEVSLGVDEGGDDHDHDRGDDGDDHRDRVHDHVDDDDDNDHSTIKAFADLSVRACLWEASWSYSGVVLNNCSFLDEPSGFCSGCSLRGFPEPIG